MKLNKISCLISTLFLAVSLLSTPVSAMNDSVEKVIIDGSVEINKADTSGENTLIPVESDILGSITIKLQDTKDGLPKNGVNLAIVRVADVSGGEFLLTDTFLSSNVDLNNIKSANELDIAASKLSKLATAENTYKTISTNNEGIAEIKELPVGVFLVYATDNASYENVSPFLVSIPTYNDKTGEMVYDIEVLPKHTPLSSPEQPEVPQTGVDNMVLEYTILSIGFLVLGGIIAIVSKMKKKEVQ